MRDVVSMILALCACACTSCGRGRQASAPAAASNTALPAGVTALDANAPANVSASQTVYVPVYSQAPIGDRSRLIDLAITLSVRNTDRSLPIAIRSVKFFDPNGRLVRDYATRPVKVAPMATMEYFVHERDKSAGTSASFLVEWSAEHAVSEPIVEALMIGSASNLAISFTSTGRAVTRAAPAEQK